MARYANLYSENFVSKFGNDFDIKLLLNFKLNKTNLQKIVKQFIKYELDFDSRFYRETAWSWHKNYIINAVSFNGTIHGLYYHVPKTQDIQTVTHTLLAIYTSLFSDVTLDMEREEARNILVNHLTKYAEMLHTSSSKNIAPIMKELKENPNPIYNIDSITIEFYIIPSSPLVDVTLRNIQKQIIEDKQYNLENMFDDELNIKDEWLIRNRLRYDAETTRHLQYVSLPEDLDDLESFHDYVNPRQSTAGYILEPEEVVPRYYLRNRRIDYTPQLLSRYHQRKRFGRRRRGYRFRGRGNFRFHNFNSSSYDYFIQSVYDVISNIYSQQNE